MSNCRKCGVLLTDLNWSPSKQDGGSLICKACDRSESKRYYKANKDRIDARKKGYSLPPPPDIRIRIRM